MARPRFEKLPAQKRERILEAAAKEFTARGYEAASLNKILAEAEISKGAAYYYFDDKADLYMTAVTHYGRELLESTAFDPRQLTADTFWDALSDLYRQQYTRFVERPWVFGIAKAGGPLPVDPSAPDSALGDVMVQAQGLITDLLQQGRDLGVVRRDLADDLLVSLFLAVDDVHDRWLYEHWSNLSTADLEQAAVTISDSLRRLLSPRR